MSFLLDVYPRLAVNFIDGEGCWLIDANGKRYLDAIAGLAVSSLGHKHPALVNTLKDNADKPLQYCNLYTIAEQEQLAEMLCNLTGMSRAFFCNSGTEANEAAIKIARHYGVKKGVQRPHIITFEHSFHGRTFGAASATNNPKVQNDIGPLLPGFIRAPFGDLAALQHYQCNPDVVAIMVEAIQGDGGVNVPPADFLTGLRQICNTNDWLLIIDEIQTGCGRTGQFCAHQHHAIRPDIITMAKGLAGGYPIGTCLARGKAAETLTHGMHGSTFGGNPMSCRMAMSVLNTIEQGNLIQHAADMGDYLNTQLRQALGENPNVTAIRGCGLMAGIELKQPIEDLAAHALAKGLMINVTQNRIIRLLPPLVVQKAEIDYIVSTLAELL